MDKAYETSSSPRGKLEFAFSFIYLVFDNVE